MEAPPRKEECAGIAINEELFLRRVLLYCAMYKIASWLYKLVDINAWQGPDAVNNTDTNELDNWGVSSLPCSVYTRVYTRRNSSSDLFLERGINSNVDCVLQKACLLRGLYRKFKYIVSLYEIYIEIPLVKFRSNWWSIAIKRLNKIGVNIKQL